MSADISRDVDQLLEVVVYREMIRRGYQGALSERAAMPGRWIPNCNPLRRGWIPRLGASRGVTIM